MTNLLECKTCNKIITSEEVDSHKCRVEMIRIKTILASSISTLKNEIGENCFMIDGLDGVGYRIIVKEPKIIPILDLSYQPTGNTDNYQPRSKQNLVNGFCSFFG